MTLSIKEEELSEKVKEFPVLHNKAAAKGYKEKDAVSNAWWSVAETLDFN